VDALTTASEENKIISASFVLEQEKVAKLTLSRDQGAAQSAQLEAALLNAEERAVAALRRASAAESAQQSLNSLHATLSAQHAECNQQLEELGVLSENMTVELASLRQYCEDQRVASLTLQDQLRDGKVAMAELEIQLTEANSSVNVKSSEILQAREREELLMAAHARQELELREQLAAATQYADSIAAELESKMAELAAQHSTVVEGFRAERARILSSYEHMLEESRRCSLKAATQQHEQYETKLQAAHAAQAFELEEARRGLEEAHAARASAQKNLDLALARISAMAQGESTAGRQRTDLEEKLAEATRALLDARSVTERVDAKRIDAEKECAALRGLVSTSVEHAKEAADRYLQQAKLELAAANASAELATNEKNAAIESARSTAALVEELEAQLQAARSQLLASKAHETDNDAAAAIARERVEHLQHKLEGLESQREELLQTVRAQQDALGKAEFACREHGEMKKDFEKVIKALQEEILELKNHQAQRETAHSEHAQTLEGRVSDLGGALAESRGETIHTRQALLNARAELDALHSQVTELLTSAMQSPPSVKGSSLLAAGAGAAASADADAGAGSVGGCSGIDNEAMREFENDENTECSSSSVSNKRTFASGGCGIVTRSSSFSRLSSSSITSSSRIRDQTFKKADRLQNPLRDITLAVVANSEQPDYAVADPELELSADVSTTDWHDRLVVLTLDLHEALVFALVEQGQEMSNATAANANGCNRDAHALRNASQALHALHDHAIRAPWVDCDSPVQSLPPAHEMVALMGVGRDCCGISRSNSSTINNLNIDSRAVSGAKVRSTSMPLAQSVSSSQDSAQVG